MILFPNKSVARPDDVRDGIRHELREIGAVPATPDIVDQASLDSFPASDPPPWTLGPPCRLTVSEGGAKLLSPPSRQRPFIAQRSLVVAARGRGLDQAEPAAVMLAAAAGGFVTDWQLDDEPSSEVVAPW